MNVWKTWSLRTRILFAAVAAFAITGVCAMRLYKNIAELLQSEQWVRHTMLVVSDLRAMQAALVDIETGSRGFAVGADERFLEPYHSGVDSVQRLMEQLQQLVADNPAQLERLQRVALAYREWLQGPVETELQARKDVRDGTMSYADFVTLFNRAAGKAAMDAMRGQIAAMVEVEEQLMTQRREAYALTAVASQRWASWGLGLSVAVGFVLLGGIVMNAARSLVRISDALHDGANQVASAAHQVAASSSQLAQGASEQASSIEETGATLEETSGTTRQNADHAQSAKTLAEQANHAAQAGAQGVDAMTTAMSEISASAHEMAGIIKTIDEIAFQTNILALNAAVEAARAGSAGAGFAVVAEEVRALAQRSAQAAREISDRIAQSTQRTQKGVTISQSLAESLQLIVDASSKVDQYVAQIAASSHEQRQGIEQISSMMNKVDKITQANAAQAEESASAAEELNAQSEVLKETLGELLHMAGRQQSPRAAGRAATPRHSPEPLDVTRFTNPPPKASPVTQVRTPARHPEVVLVERS